MAPYPLCFMSLLSYFKLNFVMFFVALSNKVDTHCLVLVSFPASLLLCHKTFIIMFLLMNKVVNIYACWHWLRTSGKAIEDFG